MAFQIIQDKDVRDILVKNHGVKAAVMYFVGKGNEAANHLNLAVQAQNDAQIAQTAQAMADAIANIRQILAPDEAQLK